MTGPLPEGSPQLRQECPACKEPFRVGDYVTLVPLGPGYDPEQRRLAAEGRPYESVALEVHFECATGINPGTDMSPEFRRSTKEQALREFQQQRDQHLILDALRRTARKRHGHGRIFTVQDVRDWLRKQQK